MSVVKISKYSTRLANKYTGEITQCSRNIKVPFILGIQRICAYVTVR